MYGTSEVKGDAGKPNFMAGITENVELIKVAYENSKLDGSGKNVLGFTFKAPNGAEFRKIFWEIDPSRVIAFNQQYPKTHKRDNEKMGVKSGSTITDEQALTMAYSEFNRQIKHIMTKYMSEDEAVIGNVDSYKDFTIQVCKKLDGKINDKKMRLKLVYQNNNFLDIPRFGNFIESMSVNPSGLSINMTYDKMTRSTPTSEEAVAGSFVGADAPGAVTNDLPF